MFYFSLKWVNIRGNIIIYLGENKIYVQLVSWPKQKRAVLLLSRFVGNHWLESYEGRALAMHKTASDKRTWHMCQILLSVSSYIFISDLPLKDYGKHIVASNCIWWDNVSVLVSRKNVVEVHEVLINNNISYLVISFDF